MRLNKIKYLLKLFVTAMVLQLTIVVAKSQTRELPEAILRIIETLAGSADEEGGIDIQLLYDTYEALLDNPINLNSASENDLRQLQQIGRASCRERV